MSLIVLKYMSWAAMSYGMQLFLSLTQVLLSLYLIVSGGFNIVSNAPNGKWLQRLGLSTGNPPGDRRMVGWLKIALGITMLLPISLGAPFWFTSIACLAGFFFIFFSERQKALSGKSPGKLARFVMALTAVLIFGLTIYEGKDMIVTTQKIFKKAWFYRSTEVAWAKKHNPNTPKVGEPAVDFELFDPSGEKRFRLSDFEGKKPVVMIFGSYT
jgi:hypothetical protein